MKEIKMCLAVFCVMGILSCSQKIVSVYYYDNTKMDGGEISSSYLRGFFVQDKNIHTYSLRSNTLNNELQGIRDRIIGTKPTDGFDDGYYGYAFITAKKDTLFADYNLSYWRYKGKGVFYENEDLKSIIKEAR